MLFGDTPPSSCHAKCPDGTYEETGNDVCQECHTSCKTCVGASLPCESCELGFTVSDTGQCIKVCLPPTPVLNHLGNCNLVPIGCSSITNSTGYCNSCEEGYKFIDETTNRRCILDCPSGQYFQTGEDVSDNPSLDLLYTSTVGICTACDLTWTNCIECSDFSDGNTCDTCKGDAEVNTGAKTCDLTCAERTILNPVTNTCDSCGTDCLACTLTECLSCGSNFNTDPLDTTKCVCDAGYSRGLNQVDPDCVLCSAQCNECENATQKCLDCGPGLLADPNDLRQCIPPGGDMVITATRFNLVLSRLEINFDQPLEAKNFAQLLKIGLLKNQKPVENSGKGYSFRVKNIELSSTGI